MAKAIDERAGSDRLRELYSELVSACNACHRATRHAFIQIPSAPPAHNPYQQSFSPENP
jgi:hypothetical protein